MPLGLFRRRQRDPREQLQDVLGGHELPSFPALVMRALELLRDDASKTAEIADLLAGDPGLTARLLKTVNSAAFSLRHPVRNIQHAVTLLGRGQVESMLISLAVSETLPARRVPGYDRSRFWHTAALRAATAGTLAEMLDPSRRGESFTAALLQDMAVPVLCERRGEEYCPILESWHHGDGDLARMERERLPWDHAEVACWMAESWKFPEVLTDAIGAHHGTGAPELEQLPAVSLVASLREVNEELGIERLVAAAREVYGLPEDRAVEAVRSSREIADELFRLFT